MILNLPIATIIAVFCIFVLPTILIFIIKHEKMLRYITIVLLCIYVVLLVIGVWARVRFVSGQVLINFNYEYGMFNKAINWGFANLKLIDIILNLIMLFPIGLAVTTIWQKTSFRVELVRALLFGLMIGIVIEAGQFLLPVKRSVQISDVLFNTISMALGATLGYGLQKVKQNPPNLN